MYHHRKATKKREFPTCEQIKNMKNTHLHGPGGISARNLHCHSKRLRRFRDHAKRRARSFADGTCPRRLLSVVAQAEAEYAAGSFVNAGRIFQDMQEGYDL